MEENQDLFINVYNQNRKDIRKKYKFLGEGISRKVYALDDSYVIKLAKGEEGAYQNKIEYYVFSNVDDNLKKYLCPIVWYRPDMLIMRRAEPLSKTYKGKYLDLNSVRSEENAANDLNFLTNKFLLEYEDIISTSSWGKLDNTNVLVDYGCTSRIGDLLYDVLFAFMKF